LKIKHFLSSLPQSVLKGDDVSLPDNVIRKLFRFARLQRSDVFYHLGCGTNNTIGIAAKEFKVKKSVGIEIRKSVAARALNNIAGISNAQITNQDILKVRVSEASVLLFWFTNPKIIGQMIKRFETELSDGARVITIWSPLDLMVPAKAEFPFFICKKPFNYAETLSEQIKAIYGSACIDFSASWLLADRYMEALEVVPGKYRKFLNMLHSAIIWINAWNTGVACEDEIPPPLTTYIGVLKTFFNIDLADLVKSRH
jgi:Histone methylation protein DOT1